jgi:Bacterial antitoxin of type II TA system, VapB
MRTTLTIADDLLAEARQRAAQTRRTISEVVEDAMREAFARRASVRPRRAADLPTSPGGPRRGVNLDDNMAVREVAEEEAPAGFRAGP